MTKDEIALAQFNPWDRPRGTPEAMQVMKNWRRRNHEQNVENGRRRQSGRRKKLQGKKS